MQSFDDASTAPSRITDYSDEQRWQAIRKEGATGSRPNRLWSEELTGAHGDVIGTDNPLLRQSFEDLAFSLLGGNGTDISDNGGFDLRNSVGIGIRRAIYSHDTTILDRLNDITAPYSPTNPLLQAQINAVRMGIAMHAMSNGIELTSEHGNNADAKAKIAKDI